MMTSNPARSRARIKSSPMKTSSSMIRTLIFGSSVAAIKIVYHEPPLQCEDACVDNDSEGRLMGFLFLHRSPVLRTARSSARARVFQNAKQFAFWKYLSNPVSRIVSDLKG